MVIIPFETIEQDTLLNVLAELVTRDGTDYGSVEYSTDQKIKQILLQLKQGVVCLCYDPETESCNVLGTADAKRMVE
jgi:hypothetical protein